MLKHRENDKTAWAKAHPTDLGSAPIVEDLRRRLRGERNPEKPQWRALCAHGTIAERLAAYADRLGIAGPELDELSRPVRHRERPDRDVLMVLLWREGRLRLGQVAPHFGVGYGAVSRACRRTERRLQTDRKFRRALEAITE